MKKNVSLQTYNSFGFDVTAKYFVEINVAVAVAGVFLLEDDSAVGFLA